jgi:hypothetical protein
VTARQRRALRAKCEADLRGRRHHLRPRYARTQERHERTRSTLGQPQPKTHLRSSRRPPSMGDESEPSNPAGPTKWKAGAEVQSASSCTTQRANRASCRGLVACLRCGRAYRAGKQSAQRNLISTLPAELNGSLTTRLARGFTKSCAQGVGNRRGKQSKRGCLTLRVMTPITRLCRSVTQRCEEPTRRNSCRAAHSQSRIQGRTRH